MACSRFNLGSGLLKALLACSLGPAALWLFPAVGWAQPRPCINTHSSLGLGCLTRDQWDRKIREWASKYTKDNLMLVKKISVSKRALKSINADRAYAHVKALMGENVKPGQGVTIGFRDNNIHPHPWFADIKATNLLPEWITLGFPHDDHGMSVVGAAAGRGGVAPGADVTVLSYIRLPGYVSKDISAYDGDVATMWRNVDDADSKYFKHVLSQNFDIFNMGGGLYTGKPIEDFEDFVQMQGSNIRNIRKLYRKTLDVLAQKNAEEKTIFVVSAGNSHGYQESCSYAGDRPSRCLENSKNYNASSPITTAGLPALAPEVRGHWIAAAATHYDRSAGKEIIGDYSNRCGIAADWCIAAPVDIEIPVFSRYEDEDGVRYYPTSQYNLYTEDKWQPNTKMKVYSITRRNGNYFIRFHIALTSEYAAVKTLSPDPDRAEKQVQPVWRTSTPGGTSIAAPVVSGSLAVMKSLFRDQLSNTELVTRLFATANKTGIYANRAIYGQGLLDLGAATNPWGVTRFMGTGQSLGVQAQDSPGEPEPLGPNSCGKGTINTHPSLELGCLTQEKLKEKVQEWATAYRAAPDFGRQWGLGAINADQAYGHLKAIRGENVKPGQGVTIGFVDSGIDPSHPAFAASKVSQKLMRGASSANTSHGTAVASVAAGAPNKRYHGVAWGADIAMFAIPAEVYPVPRAVHPIKDYAITPNREKVGLFARDDADAKFFQSVLSEDIDILNLSFPSSPFPGTIDDYKQSRLQKNYSKTIAALVQADAEEKTILVWPAGDVDPSRDQKPGSSPQLMAGLPARIKELRGHSIAVVATNSNGYAINTSNKCGKAAQWCIAAPGDGVRVANELLPQGGTAFAAPMVSGGLAVMKQLFRDQLSNTELVSRLFATAKKDGIHADSSVYGQGLMDLGAATNPWGIPAFMGTGQAVGGQSGAGGGGMELHSTSLSLGNAMGDGLSEALAHQEIAVFDSLGAPFWFSAGSFTLPAEGPSLAARLQQFLAPPVEHTIPESWQVDFQNDAPALEAGHLALTHGADRLSFHGPQGLSATLFQRPTDYDQSPLAGVALSWNPQNLPALSLAAGYLHEQEKLLGSQGSGAFGELSGHTLFLSAELDTTTPQGWQLSAQGEVGMVNPAVARSQFINDISTLTSSAFRLQARKRLDNGAAFRLALSQPLRVESGAAALSLPTGRTKDGLVVGTDLSAPLSPSGRQLDLTAQLDLPLLGGDLSLAATHNQQPQHQQDAEGQWTFFTGYRANW